MHARFMAHGSACYHYIAVACAEGSRGSADVTTGHFVRRSLPVEFRSALFELLLGDVTPCVTVLEGFYRGIGTA